jgi:hypothetical protein
LRRRAIARKIENDFRKLSNNVYARLRCRAVQSRNGEHRQYQKQEHEKKQVFEHKTFL